MYLFVTILRINKFMLIGFFMNIFLLHFNYVTVRCKIMLSNDVQNLVRIF